MSHRTMAGMPMMDNEDGRMLDTGLNRGNSAPSGRDQSGDTNGVEGRFLVLAAAQGGIVAETREQEGRRRWRT